MVAGVAVFGCLTMATMASVSAQQIGNLQGQPSNAPSTLGTGKSTRATPIPLVIACSGAFARDSHHLKLTMTYDRKNVDFGEVDAGPSKSGLPSVAASWVARLRLPMTSEIFTTRTRSALGQTRPRRLFPVPGDEAEKPPRSILIHPSAPQRFIV